MRALRCLLGVAVVVGCLLVVGGGVAVAVPASFGNGEGEGSGQFQRPHGVAVEQESGDVYVSDAGNNRVDKFGPGGEFLFAFGWGVADGHTEALQTCTTSCFTGIAGAGPGQLSEPWDVTVDNDPLSASYRDVYVVDAGSGRVEKFDSAGSFVLMFGRDVNETTNGNVCLAGEACSAGTEGSEPGEFERLGEGGGIAVDATGDVFVGDVDRVQEFSSGGVFVGAMSIPGVGPVGAVAVDSGGDVYVGGYESGGVRKFEACVGSCVGVELGEPRDATGEFEYRAGGFVALGAAGEVFIGDGESGGSDHVREYDSSGVEIVSFDANSEGNREGVAFAEGIGGLYVLDERKVRVVSPPPPGPLVVSASGGELQPTTVSVNAVMNPEGHEASYHVEYGTTAAYGSSTPTATLGGSAFEDEPVSVPLSALQPRTTYHFRVVASNSAGTVLGPDETFTTLSPVSIDSESVSGVTSTGATFATQLNPLGRDTTYRFEYGPSTAYGASVPVPDGDAGSGTSDVALSALVEHLTPGAVYHYRVVASNSLGVVDGPDRVFVTQGGEAPVLPDGRAWEMVSPPDKRGAALDGIGALGGIEIQAAADGSAITYESQGTVGEETAGNRSIGRTSILSSRTAGGWSSRQIATPHEVVTGGTGNLSEYRVFSPDLSVGLIAPEGDTLLSPQATEKTLYLREANGEYTPLVTAANVPAGLKFGLIEHPGGASVAGVEFSGATSDLGHVVVSSPLPLTEGITYTGGSENENLFEWFDGSLRLVSVLPDGKAATEEEARAKLGNGHNVAHAVSGDGSRIVWETQRNSGTALYMRDMGRGETAQLDAVQADARGGGSRAAYATASSDGSRVFFTDESRLTPNSTAKKGGEPDLYMCEIGVVAGKLACQLKDLSVDHNAGESAGVEGTAIGAGEDGRYAYFVARGVLAAGATPGDCRSAVSSDSCNLYVYDAVMGEVRFIARLSGADYQDWRAYVGDQLYNLTAGVAPDGRYLTFMSERSLTGYDNIDVHSGQPDVEVFLYDADTGHLTCASCNPSGARPAGVFEPEGSGVGFGPLIDRRSNWSGHWLAGSIPGWTNGAREDAYYRSRYLSDSGRLFFDSADALVGRDANGTEDVYEYEPNGVGGCANAGGCVGLISSGSSGEESAFLDASESGNDVFFLTAAQLVAQDRDRALDVYDARVCSASSPCLASPPAPSAPCGTADSCRAAPSSQPGVFGAPPSATFSGAGNLAPAASKTVAKKKAPSVTQKRAAALRKCRAKPRRRRVSCEAQARKRYRVGVKAKRSQRSPMRKGNR